VHGAKRSDSYLQIFGFEPFYAMHQVVAHVFHGLCPEGMEVNHKNFIRFDNDESNLEYVTRSGNILHGIAARPEERRRELAEIFRANGRKSKGSEIPYERTKQHRQQLSQIVKDWWKSKGGEKERLRRHIKTSRVRI